MPQHPSPSHRLRRAGRNVAVGPDGYPLRMHGRRVGLEVTELLLLLGIQPPLSPSLFWRFVKRAVLVGHGPIPSQTGWHTEPYAMRRLLLRAVLFVGSFHLIIVPFWRFPDCEEKRLGRYSQLSTTEKQELDLCIEKRNEDFEFARSMSMPAFLASILTAAFGPKVISVLFRKGKN